MEADGGDLPAQPDGNWGSGRLIGDWPLVLRVLTSVLFMTPVMTYLALAIVVGRDRPTKTARPLAAVTALVTTPVVLVAVLVALSGDGVWLGGLLPLVVPAGIVAAATSWWFTPKMASRPRAVSSA